MIGKLVFVYKSKLLTFIDVSQLYVLVASSGMMVLINNSSVSRIAQWKYVATLNTISTLKHHNSIKVQDRNFVDILYE